MGFVQARADTACSSLIQDEERLRVEPNSVANPTLQDMVPSLNTLHIVSSNVVSDV